MTSVGTSESHLNFLRLFSLFLSNRNHSEKTLLPDLLKPYEILDFLKIWMTIFKQMEADWFKLLS